MRTSGYGKMLHRAKPATSLSMLLVAATVSAQVVDVPTSPIDRNGNPIAGAQGQNQVPLTPPSGSTTSPRQSGNPNPTPNTNSNPGGTASPQTAPTSDAPTPNALNVDPNASIDDLVAPNAPQAANAPPTSAADFGAGRQRGLGATRGSFSSAPNMIGDIFGGSFSTFGGSQTVRFSEHAAGTVFGADGGFNSTIAFEFGTDITPNDVFTTGMGADLNIPPPSMDGNADTYAIAEPLPPNDALTSPGPGFIFDGGTAVYTGNNNLTTAQPGVYTDGSIWYIDYSYTQNIQGGDGDRTVPGPGVAARRVKLSENFSPEVRDRCFATYNFFNDAYGGLGDVSRYVLGFEKVLVDEIFSIETRMLMAGTYGSKQVLELPEARDFEFGNCALIGKGVLLRTENFLWSGGMGVTLPTADDTRIQQGGEDVLVVKNRTVHLLPFSAMLFRLTRDSALQVYTQLDVAANSDPIFANLTGGPLPQIGKFNDST
ncbi:MAG: hypothetical protein ACR2NZ_21140, partial [Rubripirellula sp.]